VSQLTSRKALSDEPVLDATNLNARFTDFASATTSINPANLRDGAVDLRLGSKVKVVVRSW
jgi:hypothetical protein